MRLPDDMHLLRFIDDIALVTIAHTVVLLEVLINSVLDKIKQ